MSAHIPFRKIREALEREVRPLGVSVRQFILYVPEGDEPPTIAVIFDIDDIGEGPVPQDGLDDFDFDSLEAEIAEDRVVDRASGSIDRIRHLLEGNDA